MLPRTGQDQPQNAAEPIRMILFVAGEERNSQTARQNLAVLAEHFPDGQSEVEIVNVLQNFQRALEHRVLLTPTLVVLSPPPPVRIVGTLADRERVLSALKKAGDSE